jgi:hypothetical protein
VYRLDLVVVNDKRIPLASDAAENGASVEAEIQSLGEFGRGVGKEADL